MAAARNSRIAPIVWFVLFVFVVPFGLAYLLFTVNQFEVGLLFALLGLFLWMFSQGAGWRMAEKYTAVIVKDAMDNYAAHTRDKGAYLFIPIVQRVVAQMPIYPLTFEFTIEAIDTQTRYLSRINKLRVRTTCTITDPKAFFIKSTAYLDRILELEATTKLRRTDPALWKEILREAMEIETDNCVRDVVWHWNEYVARDPSLKLQTTFSLKKLGELDPFDLSVNRKNLANQVTGALRTVARRLGVSIEPLVFESIEIDNGLIQFKNRDQDREVVKARQFAELEAIPIVERGKAEAEVRAITLAKLLHILIQEYNIPHTAPIIAEVVRAVLYSDGEMIWKGVLEKGATGSGTTKTA